MGMGLPQSGNEYEMYTRETNITTEKTAAIDAVELNPTVAGTIANKIKDANTYSTDEVVIGTWLGKPLYRKAIAIATISASARTYIKHNIPSFKDAIKYYGYTKDSTGRNCPIPLYQLAVSSGGLFVENIDSENIGMVCGSFSANFSGGYIVLEYTKITD